MNENASRDVNQSDICGIEPEDFEASISFTAPQMRGYDSRLVGGDDGSYQTVPFRPSTVGGGGKVPSGLLVALEEIHPGLVTNDVYTILLTRPGQPVGTILYFIVFKNRERTDLNRENMGAPLMHYPEHLQRLMKNVFHVWNGKERGTAFRLQVEGHCYWVTAGHFGKNLNGTLSVYCQTKQADQSIDIDDWDDKPDEIVVKRLAKSDETDDKVDIAFLELASSVVEENPLETLSVDPLVGDEAFFLGFPHGITLPNGDAGKQYPLPLIKRSIIAGFYDRVIYLDAVSVPGCSGGPVVVFQGNPPSPKVIGVIGGSLSGVLDPGSCMPMNAQFAQLNPGVGWATDLRWAVGQLKQGKISWNDIG